MTEAAYGYLAAAGCGLALGLHTVLPGSSRLLLRHRLLLAIFTLIWGIWFGLAPDSASWPRFTATGFMIELGLLLSWAALLHRLLRGPYKQSMPETIRRALQLYWGLITLIGAVLVILLIRPVSVSGQVAIEDFMHALLLAGALGGAALAAQLQHDAPIEDRRALRGFVFGGLVITGAETVTYAMLTMVPAVDSRLAWLRTVAIAAASLLLLFAARRQPQWSLAIFVSPQARSYAPRLLGMAVLLLIYVSVAPMLRIMPVGSAQGLALVLILATAVPLMSLLFSERLSARLRVFVSKHFLPFRYDYREEWLRLIDTLASPSQRLPLPERTIKAVAQIVGSPAGVLWLRRNQDESFHSVAHWNTRAWPDTPVPGDDPVLEFMRERQWILDTAELRRNPALYAGLSRPEWLARFPDALLVVPLISNEMLLGFIVLFQSSSAFRLTFEEIDLLRTSGRQVAAYLAQYQADQQLAEARQFEAFNRLTAFVMHDLKNLIAQQSLVVRNAARHKDNPAFFEDAIATIDNSVSRMSRLLKQLQSGEAGGPAQRTGLAAAVRDAIDRVSGRRPEPELIVSDDAQDLAVSVDRERFITVLAHLLRNAQDATPVDGNVRVTLARDDNQAVVSIEDNGCGMEPEFIRTRLFRPFDSTKGSKGMGIGAYQARSFVTEYGGTLEVSSQPGEGSCFVLHLPVDAVADTQPRGQPQQTEAQS